MAKKIRLNNSDLKAPAAIDAEPAATKVAKPAPQSGPKPPEFSLSDDLVPLGLGILSLFVAVAVEPGIRDLFQLPKQLYLADGAALLVAALGVLALSGRPLQVPRSPLLWPFLVLFGSIVLSMSFAPQQTGGVLSIFAKYDLHRWAAATAIFVVTLMGVSAPHRLWYVIGGLVLSGVVVSGIGQAAYVPCGLPD